MTRYDRFGDRVEDDADFPPEAFGDTAGDLRLEVHHPALRDHHCSAGWLGEDDDGRPIPCLICRPHLTNMKGRHA